MQFKTEYISNLFRDQTVIGGDRMSHTIIAVSHNFFVIQPKQPSVVAHSR